MKINLPLNWQKKKNSKIIFDLYKCEQKQKWQVFFLFFLRLMIMLLIAIHLLFLFIFFLQVTFLSV